MSRSFEWKHRDQRQIYLNGNRSRLTNTTSVALGSSVSLPAKTDGIQPTLHEGANARYIDIPI
jgi:hypothetical protein